MSKDVCSLHVLSTKKSAMTKVKARQHVNFGTHFWYTWLAAHSMWPCD